MKRYAITFKVVVGISANTPMEAKMLAEQELTQAVQSQSIKDANKTTSLGINMLKPEYKGTEDLVF